MSGGSSSTGEGSSSCIDSIERVSIVSTADRRLSVLVVLAMLVGIVRDNQCRTFNAD